MRPIDRFSILISIAAFKFQDLELVSNPTISIAQGGTTKLALIGVGGISSGPPGGALTFAGLDSVLLATENGSIILDDGISFENIPNLFFYARGDSVSLKLASRSAARAISSSIPKAPSRSMATSQPLTSTHFRMAISWMEAASSPRTT